MSNGGAAAAIILIRQKRIMAYLQERGALSPDRAVPMGDIPYSGTWYFDRLRKHAVIKMVGDSCYLDEAAAKEYQRLRRKWAVIAIILLALLLVTFAILLSK